MSALRSRILPLVLTTIVQLFAPSSFAQSISTNALLNGPYAFTISSYDSSSNQALVLVGRFVADGKGKLTSGVADQQNASTDLAKTNLTFTGTYSVVSNYRGEMTLNLPGGAVQALFSLAAISNGVSTQGSILQTAPQQGSGTFERQDPSAFSLAALAGSFAVGIRQRKSAGPLNGLKFSGEFYHGFVGSVTVNGSGNVTGGSVDAVTSVPGSGSSNVLVTLPLTGGNWTIDSNTGRGVINFDASGNPIISAFYVISADRLMVTGTDEGATTGFVLRQSGGPYTTASCNGTFVFYGSAGEPGIGLSADAGIGACDGNGHIAVTFDQSDAGTIGGISNAPATFTVTSAATGRFTLDDGSVGYVIGQNRFVSVDVNDTANVTFGEPQTGGPFSNASLNGAYTFAAIPMPAQPAATETFGSSINLFDGAGNVTFVSDSVRFWPPGFGQGALQVQTGSVPSGARTYNVEPNGRVTLSSGFTGYIVSPTKIVFFNSVAGNKNPLVSVATAINAAAETLPQTGWWWDPKLNGTGFFLEYGGVSAGGVFVAGFLYDAAGNNTWLVSTGQMSGSTYSNNWLKVSGGQTLTGAYLAPTGNTPAGALSINFTSPTTAVMTRPDNTQVNLQRFSFTTIPIPVSTGLAQNGWWWADPAGSAYGKGYGSGTGFGIEIQGSSVFIVAFVYDSSGNPMWYLATGTLASASSYAGSWDVYAGGPQLTSPEGTYNAHMVAGASVPMSLTFRNSYQGTLTMGNISIPITRFQSF